MQQQFINQLMNAFSTAIPLCLLLSNSVDSQHLLLLLLVVCHHMAHTPHQRAITIDLAYVVLGPPFMLYPIFHSLSPQITFTIKYLHHGMQWYDKILLRLISDISSNGTFYKGREWWSIDSIDRGWMLNGGI